MVRKVSVLLKLPKNTSEKLSQKKTQNDKRPASNGGALTVICTFSKVNTYKRALLDIYSSRNTPYHDKSVLS